MARHASITNLIIAFRNFTKSPKNVLLRCAILRFVRYCTIFNKPYLPVTCGNDRLSPVT